MVDVYRGKVQADRNLGRVALFLVFFPQIMEGPIGRYDQLANQLYEGHSFDYTRCKYGCQLILWGLFKKMVVADRAGIFVDTVFRQAGLAGGIPVVLAVLLYTLQIYAEFSGTMDIVMGVAQLFGVDLAENFKRPFSRARYRNSGAGGISRSARGCAIISSILSRFPNSL